MAARWTREQRHDYMDRAYALSLRGWLVPQIAQEFSISEKGVDRLLAGKRQDIAEQRQATGHDDYQEYRDGKLAVIKAAWDRFDQVTADDRTCPDYLTTISAAWDGIAKAGGVMVERSHHTSVEDVQFTIRIDSRHAEL